MPHELDQTISENLNVSFHIDHLKFLTVAQLWKESEAEIIQTREQKRLRKLNAPINIKGDTKLMHTVKTGTYEELEKLIALGANPDITDNEDNSPLMQAIIKEDIVMVRILSTSANIHYTNKDGNNAIMFAAASGNIEIIKLLQQHGASMHYENPYNGETPVMCALASEKLENIFSTLSTKDINYKNKNGETALTYLVKNWDAFKHHDTIENTLITLLNNRGIPYRNDPQITQAINISAQRSDDILLETIATQIAISEESAQIFDFIDRSVFNLTTILCANKDKQDSPEYINTVKIRDNYDAVKYSLSHIKGQNVADRMAEEDERTQNTLSLSTFKKPPIGTSYVKMRPPEMAPKSLLSYTDKLAKTDKFLHSI